MRQDVGRIDDQHSAARVHRLPTAVEDGDSVLVVPIRDHPLE
jgi:hypothetical protein